MNNLYKFGVLGAEIAVISIFAVIAFTGTYIFLNSSKLSEAVTIWPKSRAAVEKTSLPKYELYIDDVNYSKIDHLVSLSKKNGVLSEKYKQWFKGEFRSGRNSYKVKLRLRGDLQAHWIHEKKSWRIKFPSDSFFHGKREINLIISTDKGVVDMLWNHLARRLGLMTPRAKLVELSVNGKDFGLYYEVEHFSKEFLSYHRKTESALFSSTDHWTETKTEHSRAGLSGLTYEMHWLPELQRNYINDNIYTEQAKAAFYEMSESFNSQNPEKGLKWPHLFDQTKLFSYMALLSISGSQHGALGYGNVKLYFDPLRGQFEPVPWDLGVGKIDPNLATFDAWRSLPSSLISLTASPEMDRQRMRALYTTVSLILADWSNIKKNFIEFYGLQTELDGGFRYKKQIESELDSLENTILKNCEVIKSVLEFNSVFMRVRKVTDDRRKISISISPDMYSGVILKTLNSGTNNPVVSANILGESGQLPAVGELFPSGRVVLRLHKPTAVEAILPSILQTEIFVVFQNDLTKSDISSLEFQFVNAVTDRSVPETEVRSFLKMYAGSPKVAESAFFKMVQTIPIARIDKEAKKVTFGPGVALLNRDIVIPAGWNVVFEPSCTLKLGTDINFVSFSPVIAIGEKNRPVTIEASENEPFGTFAVIHENEKATSIFQNFVIRKGSSGRVGFSAFTGMFVIYYGKVEILDSEIMQATGEDALNVRHGHVRIERNFFNDNVSDSLDCDFCTGQVNENHFINSGGDGIDLSGSEVRIVRNRIVKTWDKAISVGENSKVYIADNLIYANTIGIAIKDNSVAESDGDIYSDNKTAISVYRKKPEFGGGKIVVKRPALYDNQTILKVDKLSTGVVEGRIDLSDQQSVRDLAFAKDVFCYARVAVCQ